MCGVRQRSRENIHDARQTFTAAVSTAAAAAADAAATTAAAVWSKSKVHILVVQYGNISTNKDPARQGGSVNHARCHSPRQCSATGGCKDLALWLLPVVITCCSERGTQEL